MTSDSTRTEYQIMERIEKVVTVNAPVQAIFRFINEPCNFMRIWPGMIEVTDVNRSKNGGRNFRCVSKMAAVRIQQINECAEYVVNRSITHKISGGMHGAIRWLFEAQNGLTQVTVRMEYEIPYPLLKRYMRIAVVQQNELDIEALLSNLKTIMEKQSLVRE
jgi:hypothetical protein